MSTSSGYHLTSKQREALRALAQHRYFHLYGGSRSGKTFLYCRAVAARAQKAQGSRHLICRFRFNHCRTSVGLDTFPKMMSLAYPGVRYVLDKQDWIFRFPNDSEVWLGGLDEKERTDKILGHEYATIYLVEATQISYEARAKVATRLAQNVHQEVKLADGSTDKRPLPLRFWSDCNPTTRAHWTARLHVEHVEPDTRNTLAHPTDYGVMEMQPEDNAENLPDGYIENVLDTLPSHLRRRFRHGQYGDATPGALFDLADIDKWRVTDGQVPAMQRVVVGVDPSGSSDEEVEGHDPIGIVVGGLGVDGIAYILEDSTVADGPSKWSKVAAGRYRAHEADVLVGEANYGGGMVEHTVRTADSDVNYKAVVATRGKVVRAEPFSALYADGRVRHVGDFRELENELAGFTQSGYVGERSPNRADAAIWVLAELLPGVLRARSRGRANMPEVLPMRYGMVA